MNGYVFASKRLVEQKRKVRFMYRETPDKAYDSGWRFFSGDETEEYVNDPENIGIYDIQTITEIDPDVLPLLESRLEACLSEKKKQNRLRFPGDLIRGGNLWHYIDLI